MEPILEVKKLQKSYGESFCLGPVDFSINQGQTLGLLGKNGAGKTTFFQLITGGLDADSGEILLSSQPMTPDSFMLKRNLGYLPQHLQLPKWATVKELLNYAAKLYQLPQGKQKIEHALHHWACEDFINRPLAACSHGMQKRAALALATLHSPKLLILDEPFSGLDLFHIKALENSVEQRSETGLATIICTHIAPYAAKLCSKVYVLDQGKMSSLAHWEEKPYIDKISRIEQYFFPEES